MCVCVDLCDVAGRRLVPVGLVAVNTKYIFEQFTVTVNGKCNRTQYPLNPLSCPVRAPFGLRNQVMLFNNSHNAFFIRLFRFMQYHTHLSLNIALDIKMVAEVGRGEGHEESETRFDRQCNEIVIHYVKWRPQQHFPFLCLCEILSKSFCFSARTRKWWHIFRYLLQRSYIRCCHCHSVAVNSYSFRSI